MKSHITRKISELIYKLSAEAAHNKEQLESQVDSVKVEIATIKNDLATNKNEMKEQNESVRAELQMMR